MSVRSSSRFLGVLALGLVAGCHPAASIAGNVLQTSAGPDVPISDARVTVRRLLSGPLTDRDPVGADALIPGGSRAGARADFVERGRPQVSCAQVLRSGVPRR